MIDDELNKIFATFKKNNCSKLFVKILAENDNSKNQVYLGSNFEALNIFPNLKITSSPDSSKNILYSKINFSWLSTSGEKFQAPNTQLIFYPQYPEVRLSGFLLGCKEKPSNLFKADYRVYGRVLFLGIQGDGKVLAVAYDANTAVAKSVINYFKNDGSILLREFLEFSSTDNSKEVLLKKLKEIHSQEWIEAIRLDGNGEIVKCNGSNCGGYTLEALFGIKNNGISEPDFMGWELKQFNVSNFIKLTAGPITLFTPEPNSGLYKSKGVEFFIRTFGYADTSGKQDRINFSSPHRIEKLNDKTGLRLELLGYEKGKIIDSKAGIVLLDKKNNIAAQWDYIGLMEHWNKKHNKTAYVPSMLRENNKINEYFFGDSVFLGEKTDFYLFLKSLKDNLIYYDPGLKIENASTQSPKIKRRNQFRIPFREVSNLYYNWEKIQL